MRKPQMVLESWRRRKDLIELKTLFFDHQSDSDDLRRRGGHLVQAWESSGRVPHVVVSTAELTQAVLAEKDKSLPVSVVVNGFCTAWVRFVNGSTDTQQHYRSKQSMYQIARQLGMPASFIELRHRITHEDKPSLRELRRAADAGLSWLYQWYWKDVVAVDSSVENEADSQSLTHFKKEANSALGGMLDRNLQIWANANDKGLNADVDVTVREIGLLCGSAPPRLTILCDLLCNFYLSVPWSVTANHKGEVSKTWTAPFSDVHDVPFHIYDKFLLQLAEHDSRIVFTLQQTLLKQVVCSRSKPATASQTGAVIWLYHLYNDTRWSEQISAGILDPRLALRICTESGSQCAERLIQLLSKGGE